MTPLNAVTTTYNTRVSSTSPDGVTTSMTHTESEVSFEYGSAINAAEMQSGLYIPTSHAFDSFYLQLQDFRSPNIHPTGIYNVSTFANQLKQRYRNLAWLQFTKGSGFSLIFDENRNAEFSFTKEGDTYTASGTLGGTTFSISVSILGNSAAFSVSIENDSWFAIPIYTRYSASVIASPDINFNTDFDSIVGAKPAGFDLVFQNTTLAPTPENQTI